MTRFRQFRLVWQNHGETKWRRTAVVVPEICAQQTLERARLGQAEGLTKDIVIPRQIDPATANFELQEEPPVTH